MHAHPAHCRPQRRRRAHLLAPTAGSLRGLTLVEALVIVAILAILVALCPVSFGRARERARRAVCAGNLKQIGLGIGDYYDERTNMPPMATMRELAGSIAPYLGQTAKLFQCPSDTNSFTATAISNLTRTSYSAISGTVWQVGVAALVCDRFDQDSPLTTLTGNQGWSPNSAHKEGGNVLWTDGHVQWMRVLDVGTNQYPVVND